MGSQVSLVLSDQSSNDPGLVFLNYKLEHSDGVLAENKHPYGNCVEEPCSVAESYVVTLERMSILGQHSGRST
jgi:hypothetical protein